MPHDQRSLSAVVLCGEARELVQISGGNVPHQPGS